MFFMSAALALAAFLVQAEAGPIAGSTYSSLKPAPVSNIRRGPGHIIYQPASAALVEKYEHRLQKRDSTFGAVDHNLRDDEDWYWGSPQNPNAKFTAWDHSGHVKLLSVNRFANILDDVHCSDGAVTFTLNDQAEFAKIQNAWSWVNTDAKKYIVMVTENQQCSHISGERQPFHVQSAKFDEAKKTVTLAAVPRTWSQAFGKDFKIKIASKGIFANLIHEADTRQSKRWTKDLPALDIGHDFSQDIFSMDVDGVQAALACSTCNTHGALDFEIDYHVTKDSTVTVTTAGVGATFDLALQLSGALTSGIDKTFPIVDVPLPYSFEIAGIASIGPNIKVTADVNIGEVTAEASLSMGINVDIPDNATATIDWDDSDGNDSQGWSPSFSTNGPTLDASVSVSGSIGPQISLELDFQIASVGLTAGIVLAAPTLDMDLTASASTDGVCGNPDASVGVEFDVELSAEFGAFGGYKDKDGELPNEITLAATTTQIFSTCMTFSESSSVPFPAGNTTSTVVSSTGTAAARL